MESKKISFGFKLASRPSLLPLKQKEAPKEAKELIKCLEGQEIKLLVEKKDEPPLVIPMIGTQKTSAALASLMKRRAVLLGEEENAEQETTQPIIDDLSNKDNEDLDKRAARELLEQLQNTNGETNDYDKLVLPILKADELPLDGAKEATIEDYDSIPIQQFGLAMLRGMGWVEPPKKKTGLPADDAPFLRPKGMGLGADKALKAKPLLIQPAPNEILEIKKLAYVRILGGKHKDAYGQIEGFDDHAGRVIVKMAIGSSKETFNEFMCLPISKKEYTQYGKCINTTKYEKYKKLENEHGQIIVEPGKARDANIYNNKDGSSKNKNLNMKHVSIQQYEDERTTYKGEQRQRTYKNEKDEERYQSRRDDQSTSGTRNDHSRSSSLKRYRAEQKNEDKKIRSSRSPVRHLKRETNVHRNSRRSSSIEESTDYSNSTKSDTDSAYERKHKKKSSTKSKKHKLKKSKSKNRRRRSDSSVEDNGSYMSDSDKSERKHSKSKHKKKSKKSKRPRSRSRSRR